MKTKLAILALMGILMSLALPVRADDSVGQAVKDDANSVADKADTSAHTAKRKIKHHARKAKTAVQNSTDDSEVRKTGRKAKDAGNDALDKVDDTVHGH